MGSLFLFSFRPAHTINKRSFTKKYKFIPIKVLMMAVKWPRRLGTDKHRQGRRCCFVCLYLCHLAVKNESFGWGNLLQEKVPLDIATAEWTTDHQHNHTKIKFLPIWRMIKYIALWAKVLMMAAHFCVIWGRWDPSAEEGGQWLWNGRRRTASGISWSWQWRPAKQHTGLIFGLLSTTP